MSGQSQRMHFDFEDEIQNQVRFGGFHATCASLLGGHPANVGFGYFNTIAKLWMFNIT